MLTGQDLLDKVETISHLSRREKAIACGYRTETGRVLGSAFLSEFLKAQGITLDPKSDKPKGRRGGRIPAHQISVQANGNLLVGSAYTNKLGVAPGDMFEVKVGKNRIQLVPKEG